MINFSVPRENQNSFKSFELKAILERTRMAISNEEWNEGRTRETIEAQILTFLKQNQKPYTLTGIMYGLGYNIEIKDFGSFIGGIASYWLFQNAIERLMREGKVQARIIKQPIGQETYYKAV